MDLWPPVKAGSPSGGEVCNGHCNNIGGRAKPKFEINHYRQLRALATEQRRLASLRRAEEWAQERLNRLEMLEAPDLGNEDGVAYGSHQ
jgi:hypothetical protein